jgi:hypothetical protein
MEMSDFYIDKKCYYKNCNNKTVVMVCLDLRNPNLSRVPSCSDHKKLPWFDKIERKNKRMEMTDFKRDFEKKCKLKPTKRGIKNYPQNGYYDEDYPCTCNDSCSDTCKGECGCPACHIGYQDVLSCDFD